MNNSEALPQILYIKHMVCPRCIRIVRDELTKLEVPFNEVLLGQVELKRALTESEQIKVKNSLTGYGFELLEDSREKLVEQVKLAVLDMVRNRADAAHLKVSELLAQAIQKDYNYLSAVFSASEDTTLEKYIILQKIEYVKELISYNELSLSEIASRLSYSSVSHLSRQFKKVTGFTPSEYRKTSYKDRKPLNEVKV